MTREILNDVSRDGSVNFVSTVGGSLKSRARRVHDLLDIEPLTSATNPEESLIIDDRCDMSPAQLVETKLMRVLGGSTLPVSHLLMRGILRNR